MSQNMTSHQSLRYFHYRAMKSWKGKKCLVFALSLCVCFCISKLVIRKSSAGRSREDSGEIPLIRVILDSEYSFYSGQAEFQSSISEQLCRSCSEYTTAQGGVVGVERSHDQTKIAERLIGRDTSTNISFKTRNSIQE